MRSYRERKKEDRSQKDETEDRNPVQVLYILHAGEDKRKLYSNGTGIVKDTRKLLDPSVRYPGSKIFQRWNGKVIGEFVCDRVILAYMDDFDYPNYDISDDDLRETCLSQSMLFDYAKGEPIYGWHISDLIIYDKPKDLSDFGMKRSPQSWCYAEEEKR